MSFTLTMSHISHHATTPLSHRLGFSEFYPEKIILRVPTPSYSQKKFKKFSLDRCLRLCSVNHNASGLPDAHNSFGDNEGLMENNETGQGKLLNSNGILKRLRRYGISGILSYGLLNTAYYLTTFLLVWFYVAPAPGKMGYFAAVKRFLKILAMVWAGSQVTKLARAGGALALAPFVDRGLSWFAVKFNFQSQGKAFMVIVGFCFGLALMLFLVVTLLWA